MRYFSVFRSFLRAAALLARASTAIGSRGTTTPFLTSDRICGGMAACCVPSASTGMIRLILPSSMKRSISRMHHFDSINCGVQMTISHSLCDSASSMLPPRSDESGSSSWSRKTRRSFLPPAFPRRAFGTV